MPVDFRIRRGKDELADMLRMLGKADQQPEAALKAGSDTFKALMEVYPPPRAGATYVRTFTLQRGWRVSMDGMRYRVRSSVSYSTYVQGAYQRWFHRETGWLTPRQVYEQNSGAIQLVMRKEVMRQWSKGKL